MTRERDTGQPPPRLFVLTVGKRPAFHRTVAGALDDLVAGSGRRLVSDEAPDGDPREYPAFPDGAPYGKVLSRALRFVDPVLPQATLRLVRADTLAQAGRRVTELIASGPDDSGSQAVALLLVDAAAAGLPPEPLDRSLEDGVAALWDALPAGVRFEASAYSVFVYDEASHDTVHVASPYSRRRLPQQPWLLAADVICGFTDYLQVCHAGSVLKAGFRPPPSALARELATFLHARGGSGWGLHYYTGSVVSGLIDDLETAARSAGNPVLRAPSEHGLACGALARWQLDEAPFLLVATSGMIDEFRGTLANLREARARGFIVCADSAAGAWYPFQGTVHAAEDSRAVLRARRIPFVYLDDPAKLGAGLREAFEAYEADRGPVVLLATADVLQAPAASPVPVASAAPAAEPLRLSVAEDALTPVMHLLNSGPERVLWQCGALDEAQRTLVHDIAADAGAALADSLTRPGTVARYRDGQPVHEYLGTLGMYGYSERVHDFLHRDGRLRPRTDQCLFFLNSRIAEAAVPFSPQALARSLRIVQVTREAAHLAPFTDHPVHADGLAFLREVRRRLDVPEELRDARRRAMAESRDSTSDVVHLLPLTPMSPNYFFHRLSAVLTDLITQHGYTYTGVYDVGRGGLSAIRNLPRTGPGFSGWYGRALMGDALQAVPAVTLTRDGNVLAFVGDGAAALTPDILPTLVEQICLDGRRPAGNLSVFRLVDGGHSVIRTYREGRAAAAGASRQTRVLHLLDRDWTRSFGPLTVSHRRLTDVDAAEMRTQLLRRSAVNLYSVLLGHNNEGDGLSLLSSLGWQRDRLPALTYAMAGAPRPGRRTGGDR